MNYYFDSLVHSRINEGRFKDIGKIIIIIVRLLEEESKVIALKNKIQEGIDSGITYNFHKKTS